MKLRNTCAGRLGIVLTVGLVAGALVVPSSALASKFGAKLTTAGPVGSTPPHKCVPVAGGCTRVGVSYSATGAAGGNIQAPEKGKIKRIRLLAGAPGNFRFFLTKLKNLTTGSSLAKAKRKGPRLEYEGNGFTSKPVERFQVGVPVKRGEFLAIKARKTSTLDCRPASTHQIVYQPPLGLGGGFVSSSVSDTCELLIQAVIK